jgi:tetratricopeptide (TPR) repeat protein
LLAARSAFWLGMRLTSLGEIGRATGWLARAERLIEGEGRDCVESGYLLLPTGQRYFAAGDFESAIATAARAAAIGDRFGEKELSVFARNWQGHALVGKGEVAAGLALLDEAMVAVIAGELSPIISGLIYCSVIATCQRIYALDRAREWTSALTDWCAEQPQIVTFSGYCLVHRAEIMQLNGAWGEAIDEARRAAEGLAVQADPRAAAAAFYQEAEVRRLKGEFAAAEEAYRHASQAGQEPQPGLALLRLAQGRREAGEAAIRRVVEEPQGEVIRSTVLAAYVEIVLAADDFDAAVACGYSDIR